MTNLLATIVPKSDQLNADDLIGRSLTITVTKVSLCSEADQPIAVHYEGDGGKPYKPCKSMRRVMVHVWGPDGAQFAGRRMTLYRDDEVRFGNAPVGGIRISHMSGIDRDVTMALTATRASRKPYVVRPLATAKGEPTEMVDLLTVMTEGRAAAARGSAALTAWWSRLGRDEKSAAKPTLDGELKGAASKADQAALDETNDQNPPHNPVTGEVDDSFPGDRPSGEGSAAGPAEANAEEERGPADDLTIWANDLLTAVEGYDTEAFEALEGSRIDLARFKQLEVVNVDLAKKIEAAMVARKRELAK